MEQIFNPYLPSYEYIPDGEPHVFDDRVYIFGSHDRFDGDKFCLNDYVCYSAPITDLKNFRYEGVIYKKNQDIRMTNGEHELWAPDVVKGKDGKYYLYYCPDYSFREIGVAVSDKPAGKYEFLGLVSYENGDVLGTRENDFRQFDPGIFIDDDGEIYLYSGNGFTNKNAISNDKIGSQVMTLCDDMLTIKSAPKKLLPIIGEAEYTDFFGHEFYEASSIRKIKNKYYFVYSSVKSHELCYAISDKPDCDFKYGGVIISNCDLFPNDANGKKKNCYGNNHGGIEFINGKWYIFYHRQTNKSMFSRQGLAEEIIILDDGSIPQVKMTSLGLNGKALQGVGTYPAYIVANLYGAQEPTLSRAHIMLDNHPYLTQSAKDYQPNTDGEIPYQYIKNGQNGMTCVFRYFDFKNVTEIQVEIRGSGNGVIEVYLDEKKVGSIAIKSTQDWKFYSGNVKTQNKVVELAFKYKGDGIIDFKSFSLIQ